MVEEVVIAVILLVMAVGLVVVALDKTVLVVVVVLVKTVAVGLVIVLATVSIAAEVVECVAGVEVVVRAFAAEAIFSAAELLVVKIFPKVFELKKSCTEK